MDLIAISARVEVDPAHIDDYLTAAGALIDPTRAEPGCHLYAFARDIRQPNLVWISEQWASEAHLARHLASPHVTAFLRAVAEIPLLAMEARQYSVAALGTVTPPPVSA